MHRDFGSLALIRVSITRPSRSGLDWLGLSVTPVRSSLLSFRARHEWTSPGAGMVMRRSLEPRHGRRPWAMQTDHRAEAVVDHAAAAAVVLVRLPSLPSLIGAKWMTRASDALPPLLDPCTMRAKSAPRCKMHASV